MERMFFSPVLEAIFKDVLLDVIHQVHEICSGTQHRLAMFTLAPRLIVDQLGETLERHEEIGGRRNHPNWSCKFVPCDVVKLAPLQSRRICYTKCLSVIGLRLGLDQAGLLGKIRRPH